MVPKTKNAPRAAGAAARHRSPQRAPNQCPEEKSGAAPPIPPSARLNLSRLKRARGGPGGGRRAGTRLGDYAVGCSGPGGPDVP